MFILIFILGLIFGSFINCVIYWLEEGRKDLKGRSFCPNCGHNLGFLDLIPVFSYLFLRARCRYCHKKISIQYPLVELSAGILFVLAFWQSVSLIQFVYFSVVFCLLLIIFVFDLKHFLIPDIIIYPALVIILTYRIFTPDFFTFLFSGFLASAFFLAIFLISRGKWIGFGDVILAFLMGFFLGFPSILVALFFGFTIGAIIGLGLVAFSRKSIKSEVPFGPFLIVGLFVAFLWGETIANWYLSLIY